MKKKMLVGFICVAMLLVSGCGAGIGSSGSKLSEKYDEATVVEEAKAVIDLVNVGDYEALEEEKWGAAMKQKVPAAEMERIVQPIIQELGAFESFEKEAITGQKDKDTEQEFAVAVILAKYEERKAQFTISFDEKMKVVGFFVK